MVLFVGGVRGVGPWLRSDAVSFDGCNPCKAVPKAKP